MFLLTELSNEPKQQIKYLLNNGNYLTLNFIYKPQQLGWFFDWEYGSNTVKNTRLVTSYNILRGFRNYLPFGLRVSTLDNLEPINQDDFINGYASVYILSDAEVATTEGKYYAKIAT